LWTYGGRNSAATTLSDWSILHLPQAAEAGASTSAAPVKKVTKPAASATSTSASASAPSQSAQPLPPLPTDDVPPPDDLIDDSSAGSQATCRRHAHAHPRDSTVILRSLSCAALVRFGLNRRQYSGGIPAAKRTITCDATHHIAAGDLHHHLQPCPARHDLCIHPRLRPYTFKTIKTQISISSSSWSTRLRPSRDVQALKKQKTPTGAVPIVTANGGASNTLFVGGLSFDAEEEDVKQFFSEFGEITTVRIPVHSVICRLTPVSL
jgi:hypothetical protein